MLALAGTGDRESFALLYDATVARAFGTALRILPDVAQTEEVVQEAYLQLWRSAGRFDPHQGTAMSWILTIVHRHAVGRARAVQNRATRDVGPPCPVRATDGSGQPVSALEGRHAADPVHRALATLTPTQRDTIELGYFGACTRAEVAERLDLPLSTVTSGIRSGLYELGRRSDRR